MTALLPAPSPLMATPAVRLGPASRVSIAVASAIGIVSFIWPLIAAPGSAAVAHATDAPLLFALIVPVLLIVVLAQMSDGGMDAKAIAMLGVLSAVIAALRPLGGGTAGLEPIWVILILGARALGPGFGFALGAISLFASALLTGGVGPWLPFQMLAAAWVGLGAGLLPARWTGRRELTALSIYAAVACIAYGFLMNLWFWPFVAGTDTSVSFVPGDDLVANLGRFWAFHLTTSLGFDLPRAFFSVLFMLVAGPAVLGALRRVARRAAFEQPVTFVAPGGVADPS